MNVLHKVFTLLATLIAALGGAQAADAPDGARVFAKWCAPCHAPGITHPGTHALMAKYSGVKGGDITEWTDVPPDYVKTMVRRGISVMPHFRKTEISDRELDALAGYVTRHRVK
ncbi:MAG: Cytochrome c6 [Pseudomonadota bacterium]|jgi:mono/diheme cytochrome c family protein